MIVSSSGKERKTLECAVTVNDILPQAPTNLKAEISDGKVELTWQYPEWSGSYDDLAMQYYVHRKKAGGEYSKLDHFPIIRDALTAPSYIDRWLENGMEYTYFITAVDPLGRQSAGSAELVVIPKDNQPPSQADGLTANPADGVITLSWNMSLELDVEGYNIYRSEGLREDYIKLNGSLIDLEKPSYYDSSIANGVQYFYTVTAMDISGNESRQSNAITALGEDRTPPDPPMNLTYEINDRVLTLTWSASKAKDLSGYYVYRGMSEDIQPKIIHEPFTDTVYADSGYQAEGMTPGKSFWVSLSAVDKSRNESEKISMIIEIPDDVPPISPQGFYAENVSGRYVNISCSASPSLDVASYGILRNAEEIARVYSAPISYRDSSVTKGNRYIYTCVAIDSAGNRSLPGKADTVFVKDTSPPPSPRNIKAIRTEQGIRLKWERVIDFDLVGYNIYRSNIPSGVYEKLNDNPLPPDKYDFLDNGGEITHYYKVKAVDSSGNESKRSKAVHAG